MSKLGKLYRKTGWHTVFSFDDEGASARTHLLFATIAQAVVGGFSGGVFYTGLLMGYGINIVNISIITFIPYITSFFTLLTPFILERFPKRRLLLTLARVAYYVINILGITVLPWVVQDPEGRVIGLVIIVFLANAINFLFSGWSPWHMPYITPEVRTAYYSATSLVSNISSSLVLIVASTVTDRLSPDVQLDVIVALRFVAFAIAGLDIYFLQKPREPEYLVSTRKHSLLNVFKLPLSDKRFRLTMLVYALYNLIMNISASVSQTWLLQEVKTGYLYINIINFAYSLFVLLTSAIWSRVMQKKGTFRSLAVACFVLAGTYCAYAFVNSGNFLWLMTTVRLVQHGIGMLQTFSVNNMLYISLPRKDQTNYTSCYTFAGNAAVFLGMSTGTAIVAAMGDAHLELLGHCLSAPAVTLLVQGALTAVLGIIALLIRKRVEPESFRK